MMMTCIENFLMKRIATLKDCCWELRNPAAKDAPFCMTQYVLMNMMTSLSVRLGELFEYHRLAFHVRTLYCLGCVLCFILCIITCMIFCLVCALHWLFLCVVYCVVLCIVSCIVSCLCTRCYVSL